MNREIKFRQWISDSKKMIYDSGIGENQHGWIGFSKVNFNDNPIMQYTGLKDKNGKEIYEGDIIISVSRNGKKPHVVIFYPELAAYCGDYGLKYPLNVHELTEIKVIGNLYENPELLEAK